jgi:2-hydroxychromene-2-carboxylate isomerase
MRGCIYLQRSGKMTEFADAAFKAYWSGNRDISRDEVIAEILDELRLDQAAFFEAIATDEIKHALRSNTAELAQRGGFGSPTFFVNRDDMYFGNDRILLVREALMASSQSGATS